MCPCVTKGCGQLGKNERYLLWPKEVWASCFKNLGQTKPSVANTNFGQSKFGQHQLWPNFGQRGCARVTTNILFRDLDLTEPSAADGPRLEVVADGLPLFGVPQLTIDTTLVSTLHANGLPRRAGVDGAALQAARCRKERRDPELARRFGRARLVVLAAEVCGRLSKETQSFLSSLAHAKARSETSLMRRRVEQAWRLRWSSLFSCTVARAVATSLLELPGARGADGDCPPSYEVERDFRHAV